MMFPLSLSCEGLITPPTYIVKLNPHNKEITFLVTPKTKKPHFLVTPKTKKPHFGHPQDKETTFWSPPRQRNHILVTPKTNKSHFGSGVSEIRTIFTEHAYNKYISSHECLIYVQKKNLYRYKVSMVLYDFIPMTFTNKCSFNPDRPPLGCLVHSLNVLIFN